MSVLHLLKSSVAALLAGWSAWAAACDPRHDLEREAQTAAPAQTPAARVPGQGPASGQAEGLVGAEAGRQRSHKGAAADTASAARAHVQDRGNAAGPRPRALDGAAEELGAALTPARLEDARGGDGGMAGTESLDGLVSGNSATNVVTGANSIQASSFAGASGIPIVIQNTGANVLIQNATVINLQFK